MACLRKLTANVLRTPMRTYMSSALRKPKSLIYEFEEFIETVPHCDNGRVDLEINKDKGIAYIRINNPRYKNALTGPMILQLSRITSALAHWKEGKAAVLIGADNQFCSGGDLKRFMNYLKTPDHGYLMSVYMQDLMKRFSELPFLKVAVLQGKTVGGGAEITTTCDFRLIQENAEVGFVQGKLGLTPGFGGGTRLVNIVGKSVATKMLLSASILTAKQSLDIKFADAIFPKNADGTKWTEDWLEKEDLLNLTPDVIQNITRITSAPDKYEEEECYAIEAESLRSLWMSDEHIEAVNRNIKHRRCDVMKR